MAQIQGEKHLLRVSTLDEKVGFINIDGEVVIPTIFDIIHHPSEGFVAVNQGAEKVDYFKEGGKWGFWSVDGKEVIEPKYEEVKGFKEGLAIAKLNGKYGYIDTTGKVIIDFQFDEAKSFHEDLAIVKINEKYGFIDRKGNFVIAPNYDGLSRFQHGFSRVYHELSSYEYEDEGMTFTESEGKRGLINRKGELVVDTIYDYIDEFENGFAVVTLNDKKGLMDSLGKIVIPIEYDEIKPFSEGLAVVGMWVLPEEDWNYSRDKDIELGKKVMDLYEKTDDFNAVFNHPIYKEYEAEQPNEPYGKLLYGFINMKNEIVIKPRFEQAESFKNGYADVRIGHPMMIRRAVIIKGVQQPSYGELLGNGMNLIDCTGKFYFKKTLDGLWRFDKNLWIINPYRDKQQIWNGTEIITFDTPNNLQNLGDNYFASVSTVHGSKIVTTTQLFDKNGKRLFKTKDYFNIEYAGEDRFIVAYITGRKRNRTETLYGIIDSKQNWILKPTYDTIF